MKPDAALAAARLLEAEGFLVVPIRPPTVPAGTARLRFAFTARHDDARHRTARRSRAHPRRHRRMTAVFITATGTDIGKTFIARGMKRYVVLPSTRSGWSCFMPRAMKVLPISVPVAVMKTAVMRRWQRGYARGSASRGDGA